LDINKIFGAFNSSSKDEGWDYRGANYYSPRNLPEIDENHPSYFINIFQKLVINYTGYSDKLINFFANADPEIDVYNVKKAGENMLYNRAYEYIVKIDLQDKYHIKILFEETNPKLEESLNKTLSYFENEEEYEKCAILKKYLDFLNFSS